MASNKDSPLSRSQDVSTDSGDISHLRVNRRLVMYSSSEYQENRRIASESSKDYFSSEDNMLLSECMLKKLLAISLAKKPSKQSSVQTHGASSAPQSKTVVEKEEHPVQNKQVEDSMEEEEDYVDPTNNDEVEMARDKTPNPEIVEDLAGELDGEKNQEGVSRSSRH